MKKIISKLMILAMIFLTGCGNKETSTAEDLLREVSYDLNITPEHCPHRIRMYENKVYFYDLEFVTDSWKFDFYCTEKGGDINAIDISYGDVIIYDFIVNERGNINTYEFDYWEGEYYITEYSLDGEKVSQNKISGGEKMQGVPCRMDDAGSAGILLYDSDDFYCVRDNVVSEPIMINDTVRDYVVRGKDLFAITEDGSKKVSLTMIDLNTSKVTKIKSADLDLYSIYLGDGGFFVVSADGIHFYDEKNKQFVNLLSTALSGLNLEKINNISGGPDNFDVISWRDGDRNSKVSLINYAADNGGTPVKPHDDAEYTTDGRKIIEVMADSGYGETLSNVVLNFNDNNDKFYVEMVNSDISVLDRIGRGDEADIIIVDSDSTIRELASKGIICELDSLIENSGKYSINDFEPKARDLLSVDGKLYGINNVFALSFRATYGDEFDENAKCDVISFLNWYGDYMKKLGINQVDWWRLEPIISSAMLEFVDADECKADFSSDGFMEILLKLKDMCEGTNEMSDSFANLERNDLDLYGGNSYNSYFPYVQNRERYGFDTAGFPKCDGSQAVYISVMMPWAITAKSDNPDGALEFMMYYVYYDKMHPVSNVVYDGRFYMSKEMLQADYSELPKKQEIGYDPTNGEVMYMTITDKDKEFVYNLINSAVPKPKESDFAATLYWDDIGAFLFNGKSLEDTVKVMTGRMETYLAEQK